MTLQLSTDVEGGYPLDLPSSVEKKDIEGGFPLELSSPAEKKEVEQEGVKKVEKPYSKDCFSLLLIEGGGNGRCLYLFGFFVPLLQIAIFMMFLIYASAASAVETVVDEYRAEWPRCLCIYLQTFSRLYRSIYGCSFDHDRRPERRRVSEFCCPEFCLRV